MVLLVPECRSYYHSQCDDGEYHRTDKTDGVQRVKVLHFVASLVLSCSYYALTVSSLSSVLFHL